VTTKHPKPTLLVDGDIFAYRAAQAAQKDVTYPEDGLVFRWAWQVEGEAILDEMLEKLRKLFDPDVMVIYLTEITPMAPNWRSGLLPDYKANRRYMDRPQLLPHLRGYMRDKWGASSVPGLEADDLLGMHATTPREGDGARIIVTIDKDLRCIPGLLHIWGQYQADGSPVVETVTPDAAEKWHMAQTLAGDRVDNYGGCPGLGITRALRLMEAPVVLNPENGIVTRGPRKGERTTKWMPQPTTDLWACVVSHYVKEGLGEEEALTQARVSHILRDGDYDWTTGKVSFWEPYR
jgi:hypothetical protein